MEEGCRARNALGGRKIIPILNQSAIFVGVVVGFLNVLLKIRLVAST